MSLFSRNASLVRRFAYSLKLYAANCSPCRSSCRYCDEEKRSLVSLGLCLWWVGAHEVVFEGERLEATSGPKEISSCAAEIGEGKGET
jgi:hypothetical protein